MEETILKLMFYILFFILVQHMQEKIREQARRVEDSFERTRASRN